VEQQQGDVGVWLERLGSAAPTPGGGAAAALAASAAAALVEMVVNLTKGKKAYEAHESHVHPIGEQAATLRRRAWDLAATDEAAFGEVMAAYRLPRQTDEERNARTVAIERATVAAAQPPLQVAAVAAAVIKLAASLPDRSNPNVLSDVGVAASLAVSALESAAINVEVNLGGLTDPDVRDSLRKELDGYLAAGELGRRVAGEVRARLTS
jgi:methenyltetrahydrofolate cyclohydrolase